MSRLRAFAADERGLEVTEYAVILGLITAGALGLMAALGGWIVAVFTSVVDSLST